MKVVVYKDGTYKFVENGITWEYENDPDWLVTIELPANKDSQLREELAGKVRALKQKVPFQEGRWLPIDDTNVGFNSGLDQVLSLLGGKGL